ncbi:MAG: ABC transporter substrate-binding protein [Deltaproteobacteria bacterium]|nr:ABC transporter substrate-binding protein [Deltaproteobacteria bacterium]
MGGITMRGWKVVLATAGAVGLGLLAAGGADLGARPAGAQELKEVRMGYLPLVSWAPYFLAIEKGYYREQGLRVELSRFRTAADMYGALKTATLEVGTGSVAAGHFNSVAKGVRMKIVGDKGTLGPGCGYSYFLVRKDLAGEITSPRDLKGRRIMLNAPAGAPVYLLARLLERAGLTYKDVKLVYLGFPQMPVAFRQKAIDVAHIVDPQGVRAIEAGDAEPFLNSREVPIVNGAGSWWPTSRESGTT